MSPEGTAIIDFHSHLLAGVDDGARNVEEALEGVARMVEAGVGHIVTTPHFMGSIIRDSRALTQRLEELDRAWDQLSSAVRERWPALTLERGVELLLDDPDLDPADPRLRLAGGPAVLVEWPGFRIPPRSAEVLAAVVDRGYRPVLAHPERYGGHTVDARLAIEWRTAGAVLQVNHGSLVGRYGAPAQRAAEELLAEGLVDCLCTDFHARPHYQLMLPDSRERFRRAGVEDAFDQLTRVNPARILEGQEPIPVAPLELEVGLWDRVRGLFGVGE